MLLSEAKQILKKAGFLMEEEIENQEKVKEIKDYIDNFKGEDQDLYDYLHDNYEYLTRENGLLPKYYEIGNRILQKIKDDNKEIWKKYGDNYYKVTDHEGLKKEKCFKDFLKLAREAIENAKPNSDAKWAQDFILKWDDGSPEEEKALDLAIYNMWLEHIFPHYPTEIKRIKSKLFHNGSFDQEMDFKHFAEEYSELSPGCNAYKKQKWEKEQEEKERRKNELEARKQREKEEEEELKKKDRSAWYDKYVRNTINDPSWRGPNGNWSLD